MAMHKGTCMKHVSGDDRNQMLFFALEEMVPVDSWARTIDLFVDTLPLKELGFKHADVQLHSCGLLNSSYLPDNEQESLRTVIRYSMPTTAPSYNCIPTSECRTTKRSLAW